MAYLHPHMAGITLCFMLSLSRPGTTLLVDEVALLRDAMRDVLRRRPFHIDACVVLPDRLHAVWTLPEADMNYAERWGGVKAHFSRHLRRAGRAPDPPPGRLSAKAILKGEVGIWAKGFARRLVQDAEDYRAAVAACHNAPVSAGLAAQPEAWPFSSIHRDLRLAGQGQDPALPRSPPQPAQASLFAPA